MKERKEKKKGVSVEVLEAEYKQTFIYFYEPNKKSSSSLTCFSWLIELDIYKFVFIRKLNFVLMRSFVLDLMTFFSFEMVQSSMDVREELQAVAFVRCYFADFRQCAEKSESLKYTAGCIHTITTWLAGLGLIRGK